MKYCNLGELRSSAIVAGCMRIAGKTLRETEKMLVEALRGGVNTFDLADIYGGGDCERIFGVAMKDLELPRKDYVLQTKCGIRKDGERKVVRFDFSRDYIITSAENSLKRLNTEYIDVLLLHRPDTLMEAEEVAEAFMNLYQLLLFAGALCMTWCGRKQKDVSKLILMICVLGGFLFHMIWEGKSQYIISYFPLLLPCAALGFDNVIQAGGKEDV